MGKKIKILSLFIASVILFGGCAHAETPAKNYDVSGFSVHFLDVGQADAAFVNFPDGTNFMIDTGSNAERSVKVVTGFLTEAGINRIDRLALTHPSIDHVGGSIAVAEMCEIGTVYEPYIIDRAIFPAFASAENALTAKGAVTEISHTYLSFSGENYFVAFLSPTDFFDPSGSSGYSGLNNGSPSEREIKDASPIIYLEYMGVRFVFTGDAGASQERLVTELYDVGTLRFKDGTVNLESVDFLKVSDHGGSSASCTEFLELLKPRYAVISSGENTLGYPSTDALVRIENANPDCIFLRTDTVGTISVVVGTDGIDEIHTQFKG